MQYIKIVVEESEDVEGRTKMTDKVIENNQVTVMGEVVSNFSYSHEIYGEGFYMAVSYTHLTLPTILLV